MRSCFSLKVQQNYWRLKKKKWEIENVIRLANVLPYRYLSEEIIQCEGVDSLYEWEEVNSGSFYATILNCLLPFFSLVHKFIY